MKRFVHILWVIWCVLSMIVSLPWLLMTFANITGLIYKYDYTMDEGTAGIIVIFMLIIWLIFVLFPLITYVKYTFKKKQ